MLGLYQRLGLATNYNALLLAHHVAKNDVASTSTRLLVVEETLELATLASNIWERLF
jgi:hypothetical protein